MAENHLSGFYVVTMVSNPERFASRGRLYCKFRQHMQDTGVSLLTAEIAFGGRPHEHDGDGMIRLRSDHQLWHKENALNIAISRLPDDWRYVAWIDADVHFLRPDWATETIEQLQHFQVVQMFQQAIDLGPECEALATHQGFVHCWRAGRRRGKDYTFWHPGYAWAARREAIDSLGGLIDWGILGAGDHHMALALIGSVQDSLPGETLARYNRKCRLWQERAESGVRRNVGFVPGTILHDWHGKKADRRYVDRWKILLQHGYDPDNDIRRDWQGLIQLDPRKPRLRDDIRAYFRARREDSTDLE